MSCSLPTTRRRLSGSPIRTIFTGTTWPRGPTRQVSGSPCRSIRTGKFEGTEIGKKTWPRRTKVREFKGNTSHSNFDGFMADRGPRPDGHFAIGGHIVPANPADANSPQVESVFEDFTSYKNRNSGIWARGEMHLYKNLKMADNAIGYTHASGNSGRSAYTSRVVDSLFVGETENIGNPRTPAEKAYGRSLPEPAVPDFPIRAYEFYDYRHELDNDTFVNYQDNATRKTGAISYLLFTSFGMSSNNTIQRAKFINAKPVYFPPMEYKWSNDDYGSGSYRSSVFHDQDGSVGGVPNSYIVINGGIAPDEACEMKPTWNADVCKGDVGRMTIGAGGGGGGAWRWSCACWRSRRCARWCCWRSWRPADLARAAPGAAAGRGGAGAGRSLALSLGRGWCWCKDWSHRRACAASSRSQPQRQGFPRLRCNQRTRRHRVQGNHRKADPVPQRVGTGCRFVGDVRAAGIHHRSLGYGAGSLDALRKASATSYYKGNG